MRLSAAVADAVLLCAGPVTAVALSASGTVIPESYGYGLDVLNIIVLCFLALITVVEIISMFKISDSTVHTVLIAAAVLGYCLSSCDFTGLLARNGAAVDARAAECVNFAFFIAATLAVANFWKYTYSLPLTRMRAGLIALISAAAAGLYAGLSFVNLQIIGYAVYILLLAALVAAVYRSLKRRNAADFSFFTSEALVYTLCGSSLAVVLCTEGYLKVSPAGFVSFYCVGAIIQFALIYVAYALRADRAKIEAGEYKLKYERVRTEALRGQIKPHFIFNSLAAIQSLYHKSLEAGDSATSLFSRHLRANVEAANTDLIPFERELDNIQVYADLENMRRERKFNLIFDIEETDFQIPVLSLQPYIENAMRYSKVNEKPDGFIKISSRRTENGIVVEVADNGVGFDPDSLPPDSCGIRNSRERFEVLMGITPQISAAHGCGATVTIVIPASDKEEK